MATKTIVKLVFLVIMTIATAIFVFANKFAELRGKIKKEGNQYTISKSVVRVKLISFLVLLICAFIAFVI